MNTTTDPVRHSASFRDPAGFVFREGPHVRRAVTDYGLPHMRAVRATGLVDRLIASGRLWPEREMASGLDGHPEVRLVLEHPLLPFVSYPYEWPFRALQAAALLHLDVQIEALDADVMLTDASAYNVQFVGAKPVFIDHLAFRPYRDGELWAGHRQFCEQFLHPLLLQSLAGVEFQPWYRGRLEGIAGPDLLRLLRWRQKLRWNVLTNVVAPARLQRFAGRPGVDRRVARARLPKNGLRGMFTSLRRWIVGLVPRGLDATPWASYEAMVPDDEARRIAGFVDEFVRRVSPRLLWDLGCNTGRHAEAALQAGARYVVGLDSDAGALDRAFARARDGELALLPLLVDLVNPSPGQGWRGEERQTLSDRGRPDGLLALAVVHHIAIARNVPLSEVVALLTTLAPEGVVGFVPSTDRRAQALFRGREEIFQDYSLETFLRLLQQRARLVKRESIPGSERTLLWFSTRSA